MNHMDHHHNHRRKKEYESSCLTKLGCTYQTTKNPKLQKHKRVDVDENLDENGMLFILCLEKRLY